MNFAVQVTHNLINEFEDCPEPRIMATEDGFIELAWDVEGLFVEVLDDEITAMVNPVLDEKPEFYRFTNNHDVTSVAIQLHDAWVDCRRLWESQRSKRI